MVNFIKKMTLRKRNCENCKTAVDAGSRYALRRQTEIFSVGLSISKGYAMRKTLRNVISNSYALRKTMRMTISNSYAMLIVKRTKSAMRRNLSESRNFVLWFTSGQVIEIVKILLPSILGSRKNVKSQLVGV